MAHGRGWRRWVAHLLAGAMVVLGLATLATPASATDTGLLNPCSYRSGFSGSYYCLVKIEDVTSTRYGTGKRVYLSGATVTAVTATTVTVAQLRDDCVYKPGTLCGQSLYYVYLTVPWTGTHRPPYGYVIRLYGTSTTGSLQPVGYVKGEYCPIEWC